MLSESAAFGNQGKRAFTRRELVGAGLFLGLAGTLAAAAPRRALASYPSAEDLAIAADESTDLVTRLGLPQLTRMNEADYAAYVAPLKVAMRPATIGVTQEQALKPETAWKKLYTELSAIASSVSQAAGAAVDFSGTTASELNALIASSGAATINVSSPVITIDEPISLVSGTHLVGAQTQVVPVAGASPVDSSLDGTDQDPSVGDIDPAGIAFYAEDCDDISIQGFVIDSEQFGICAFFCSNVYIARNTIQNIRRRPVVVVGGHDISIRSNIMQANKFGGIYAFGNIDRMLIEDNVVTGSMNTLNVHAALVLMTARNDVPYSLLEVVQDLYVNTKTIDKRLDSPHNVVVYGNDLSGNKCTALYDDGAYLTYIVGNRIDGNDKEGICLDFGTVATYISANQITNNGYRAAQTDDELRVDAVLEWGRLPDGSSPAKLPGLSLDNAIWAVVDGNRISGNAGSGVKFVRSTVESLVVNNTIDNNNLGQNDDYHGFGVELSTADVTGDVAQYLNAEMDSTPDYENVIALNTITGAHWSGVYICQGCFINDVARNKIDGAGYFSVECTSELTNAAYDNETQLPTSGI